jgi:coenzyme F420-reducing hydrogenase alpha subunit
VLLRKFGQEVIRITAGKRVHGTGSVPGGVNKRSPRAERDELLADADQMVAWSRDAVHIAKRCTPQNPRCTTVRHLPLEHAVAGRRRRRARSLRRRAARARRRRQHPRSTAPTRTTSS